MKDFTKDPKEKIWGKSKFSGLGGVLKTSYHSTTLQEVGILPILVYSHFLWIDLWKECIGVFKGLFGLFLDNLWSICGRFCWLICDCLCHVQRSVLRVVWIKNLV